MGSGQLAVEMTCCRRLWFHVIERHAAFVREVGLRLRIDRRGSRKKRGQRDRYSEERRGKEGNARYMTRAS